MHPSFSTIIKLFTFRAKPQDIDTRNDFLLSLLIPNFILMGFFYHIFMLPEHSIFRAYIIAAGILASNLLLIYALLNTQNKPERWTQTCCATIGVDLLIIALLLLIWLFVPEIINEPRSANAITLAIFIQIWGFCLFCMILKEALECSLILSILLNIGLIIISHYILLFLTSIIL